MSIDTARSEAARVAAHVDLRDVRMWGVQADLLNVPDGAAEDRLSYKFNADLQVQYSAESAMLLVLGAYSIEMRAVPDDDGDAEAVESTRGPDEDKAADEDEVASLAFKLNALFSVEEEPDEPFTEGELTAFGQTTGQFALYPYAREFVADLSRRMGLPALHMGVMRLHLDSRNG